VKPHQVAPLLKKKQFCSIELVEARVFARSQGIALAPNLNRFFTDPSQGVQIKWKEKRKRIRATSPQGIYAKKKRANQLTSQQKLN
jgi:hypothetical protein